MDTLAMHRRLTGAGFEDRQADAIIDAVTGGMVTKQDLTTEVGLVRKDLAAEIGLVRKDLDLLRAELKGEVTLLGARVDKLDQKVTLTLWGLGIAILAPAVTRLLLG